MTHSGHMKTLRATITTAAAVALTVGALSGAAHAATPMSSGGSGTGPLGWQTRTFTYKPAGSIFAQFLDATIVEAVTEDPQGIDFSQRPSWAPIVFTPGSPAGVPYVFCSGGGSDLITYNHGIEVDTETAWQFEKDPHTTCANKEGLEFTEVDAVRADGRWSDKNTSKELGGA